MDKYNKRLIKGFTLGELMIVVVIIGIIAAFGMPTYTKMIRKSRERNAILALTLINKGNEAYAVTSVNGQFLTGTNLDRDAINAGLSIDIKALDMTFDYDRSAPGAYIATAVWDDFTVGVNENAISGANPYCAAGPCPTL